MLSIKLSLNYIPDYLGLILLWHCDFVRVSSLVPMSLCFFFSCSLKNANDAEIVHLEILFCLTFFLCILVKCFFFSVFK